MRRVSLAGLLGFIGVVAVGLAALVNATNIWAGLIFSLMAGSLLAGAVGAVIRGRRGGAWVGFTVFGWGYLLLGNTPDLAGPARLLSEAAADWVFERANPAPAEPVPPSQSVANPTQADIDAYRQALEVKSSYDNRSVNARPIGHWINILLYAQAGAVFGGFMSRRRPGSTAPPPGRPDV